MEWGLGCDFVEEAAVVGELGGLGFVFFFELCDARVASGEECDGVLGLDVGGGATGACA